MTISTEIRALVRGAYGYRCGYCDISKAEIGSELEIDHYQPISQGGTDEIDNLVCVCTACNRFKGSYWPSNGTPDSLHLLHPGQDDISIHIVEMSDGRRVGLTSRGWFHIRWLHLNRPQLIKQRELRAESLALANLLEQTQAINTRLRQRILELEEEIERLQVLIRQTISAN